MENDYKYNAICDSCGWKRKSTEMRQRWDGLMVCRDTCWESRHPMDFYRTRNDTHKLPWTRPEPSDTFTEVAGYALRCEGAQCATLSSAGTGSQVADYPITVEAMVLLPNSSITSVKNIYRWGGGGLIFRVGDVADGFYLYYTPDAAVSTRVIAAATGFIPSDAGGRWARLSMVVTDSTTATAYLNYRDSTGTQQTVTATPSTSDLGGLLTYTGGIIVGNTPGSVEPAPGPIDDIRIWSTARTADQVNNNWDKVVPATSTGLVSNWRFDDLRTTPPSTTTTDSVITTESLTLVGATPLPHMMTQGT